MTNDDKDLKCPFCSGENISEHGLRVGPKPFYRCNDCGACAKKELWKIQPTPQQPSEPLKELDEKDIIFLTDKTMEFYANNFDDRADAMCFIKFLIQMIGVLNRKLIQPSEKKALDEKELYSIMSNILDREYEYLSHRQVEQITKFAQAIFDALPAQREVRYPEKYKCFIHDYKKPKPKEGGCSCMTDKIRNDTIEEFKKLNGGSNGT